MSLRAWTGAYGGNGMAGRLSGLHECADPECVLASSKALVNIDAKEERFCRDCEQRLFEGKMHI